MKLILILFVFFQSIYSFSQLNYKELTGVVRINDSLFIPYEVYLKKDNVNEITGYSITDKNGAHETKSAIKGIYDPSEGILKFNEFDILYTKSSFNTFDFCYIHFEAKAKNFEKLKMLTGNFYGKYDNGTKCIDGKLILADKSKIEAKQKKIKRKLNKTKYKKTIEVVQSEIDSIQLKNIVANEALTIFVKSKNFMLSIYDSGKIDDDRINLFIDGKLILEDYSIKKEKKEIPLQLLNAKTSVKVVALNEGTSAPNTVKIEIIPI